MDDVHAVAQLLQQIHGIQTRHVAPVGIDLKADIRLLLQLGMHDISLIPHGKELAVMIVEIQLNSLCTKLGRDFVAVADKLIQLCAGREIVTGHDVAFVADGLMIRQRLVKLVYQIAHGRMGTRKLQVVLVQHGLHFFRAVIEESGEFHGLIAHSGHFAQSTVQIVLGNVTQAVHLNSVFHKILLPQCGIFQIADNAA